MSKARGKRTVAVQFTPSRSPKKGNVVNAPAPHELLIIHVDVDQGESTLLIERKEKKPIWCAIIDGGFGTVGRGALIRYLRNFEVTTVDLLICSHFDGDHTKGFIDLLAFHAVDDVSKVDLDKSLVRIEQLLVRNNDENEKKSTTKLKLLEGAKKNKVLIEQASKGKVQPWVKPSGVKPRTVLTCLRAAADTFPDENDGSLAFRLTFGNFSYYTAGDLPSELETELDVGAVNAFKCGHHGSANSTPTELLEELKAPVAIISCGRNSFGHPSFDVVERLCADDSPVQGVYLTNCIHNRRCINDKFDEFEKEIINAYVKFECMKSHKASAFTDDDGDWDPDSIEDAIEAIKKLPKDDPTAAQQHRVLRGMLRSARHAAAENLKKNVIGHVAGDASSLGTVTLRVDEKSKTFHIGFTSGQRYWWHACDGAKIDTKVGGKDIKMLEDIAGKLKIVSTQEKKKKARTEPPPETQAVKGSPQKFKQRVEERFTEYSRFTAPTVTGLQPRKERAPEVPFCALCYLDFDAETPDFEFVTIIDEDEDPDGSWFHRLCFYELMIKNARFDISREDAYDEHEIEIDSDAAKFNRGLTGTWPGYVHTAFRDYGAEVDVTDGAGLAEAIRKTYKFLTRPKQKKKKKKNKEQKEPQ